MTFSIYYTKGIGMQTVLMAKHSSKMLSVE